MLIIQSEETVHSLQSIRTNVWRNCFFFLLKTQQCSQFNVTKSLSLDGRTLVLPLLVTVCCGCRVSACSAVVTLGWGLSQLCVIACDCFTEESSQVGGDSITAEVWFFALLWSVLRYDWCLTRILTNELTIPSEQASAPLCFNKERAWPNFCNTWSLLPWSLRVCRLKPYWFSYLELWQRCCTLVKCCFGLLPLPFDVVINSIRNLGLEQRFSCWDGGSSPSRHQLLDWAQSIAVRCVTPLKQRHLQIFVISLCLLYKILRNFYCWLRFPIALTM